MCKHDDTHKPEVHSVSCNVATEGPSHGHGQYAQEIGEDRTCSSGHMLEERQTDTLITILRHCTRGRSNNKGGETIGLEETVHTSAA